MWYSATVRRAQKFGWHGSFRMHLGRLSARPSPVQRNVARAPVVTWVAMGVLTGVCG